MNIKDYHARIENEVKVIYNIADKARGKGLDPKTRAEIAPAKDLAGRVEGLVGPPGIAEKIRELLKKNSRDQVALRIIDEIFKSPDKYENKEKLCEQCIRTSLAIFTEGVAVASTEGISKIKIKENKDGTNYLAIYFVGPIRAAGGTAASLAVVAADYTRKLAGIGVYKPSETEVERYVEEVGIYHNSIARLQYFPKEEEIRHIITNCPVCIDGEPLGLIEVSVYRDVPGVETNMVRGGMALVVGEGIAQKATKLLKFSKKHNMGWDWLEGLIKVEKKSGTTTEKVKPIDLYLEDIVGGRPIFAYPSTPGGFRPRYGRARNSGINARCINPATMYVLDEFPAIGTQLKVERPGKGTAITPCDTIEGPVVRLKNGDVIRVETTEKAIEILPEIDEILFLGDMLISYGDFLKSNHPLLPSGICEEYWALLTKEKGLDVDPYNVSAKEAIELGEKHKIPLHPKYTYFYGDITKDELFSLIKWLKKADFETIEGLNKENIQRLVLNVSEEKRILEKLCIPHKVRDGRIIIEDAEVLVKTLGLNNELGIEKLYDEESVLDMINKVSAFPVMNKAPAYIGVRMGRPEKAKERLMAPAPHGLVPVGPFGGKTRSIVKAADKGKISLEVSKLVCPNCKEDVFGYFCKKCEKRTEQLFVCLKCGRVGETEDCEYCRTKRSLFNKKVVDFKEELDAASKMLNEPVPEKAKGVLGMTNAKKYFEPLEKAILRAKHNVYVFKDGTVRFDSTDLTLTHFRPREIGVTVERLKELGYMHDHLGNPLTDENQVLELKPQDIVVAERAGIYLQRVSQFVDDLLEKFYGLERFYKVEKREDLVGHLVIGLAPHISAGVVGRIIGFTRARGTYAHPYYFCAQRRDADGDECSIMLLMDALLNFSMDYLPNRTGGTMDAPLVISTRIDPTEVDDQVYDMEVVYSYPLEFYRAAEKGVNPIEVKIERVADRLGTERQYYGFGFTHDTKSIDAGPTSSRYAQLKTMSEKVERQLELARKIRAVNEKDVASRLLNFHFLRDIYGNLRSFGQQKFRCVECNMKYRRVPLVGKCSRCGGKLLLTVNKGGIQKYLKISQDIAEKYGLSDYLKQRLKLIEKSLETIFTQEEIEEQHEKQISLADFI